MAQEDNAKSESDLTIARAREAAGFIMEKIAKGNKAPAHSKIAEVAVVLGSGLGGFADTLSHAVVIPYEEIPHFPRSTAPGHKGRLVFGIMPSGSSVRVLCMQGRFHLYEGYSMKEVTFHIRVMRELGISRLLLTNASGGTNPDWEPGDLMLITDHINFMGQNPLAGANVAAHGARFPDMSRVYDREYIGAARIAARELGITLREGVYVGFCGPSYETPAEIAMFQKLGASAVGMSTVPEAIVANHCGIRVLGISCVTNAAAGIKDQTLTEADVIESAEKSGSAFLRLLGAVISEIT